MFKPNKIASHFQIAHQYINVYYTTVKIKNISHYKYVIYRSNTDGEII